MKHKDLGLFTYQDCIQVACPEEFDDASELPEEILKKLYPDASLGPAFPQILQMHKELHFANSVAVKEPAANTILSTILEIVNYTSAAPNTSHPIGVIHVYKLSHLEFLSKWQEAGWSEAQNTIELANVFNDMKYGIGEASMVSLSTALSAALTISVLNPSPNKTAAAEYILQRWRKCVNDIKELPIPQ